MTHAFATIRSADSGRYCEIDAWLPQLCWLIFWLL